MQAVVLAADEGTRPQLAHGRQAEDARGGRRHTIVEDGVDNLIDVGPSELVAAGHKAERIIDRFGGAYKRVPITHTHQREQFGLAHAISRRSPTSTATSCSCSAATSSATPSATRPVASGSPRS